MTITTVAGPIARQDLGKTLMHEHLVVGFAGWEQDRLAPGPTRRELVALCVERIEELKAAGYRSMVDPCPNDVGRDVDLMGEVAARTGFNIIAATGFYHEAMGANAHWRIKAAYDPDFVDRLAELMIRELTDGVDGGVKPGVIKLATGTGAMTDYEEKVFRAGAKAALATDTPITTHTEAVLGDAQLDLLTGLGVPAHRIIIGHCCGSRDHHYHMALARAGAYVGFDRFGVEDICSDEDRTVSLVKVIEAGGVGRTIVSHDSVWCLRGNPLPAEVMAKLAQTHTPLRFERVIAPRLQELGVSPAQIETLLVDNPRRYFSDEPPPPLGY
jgi:phosphotriesterase-related protein